VRSPELKAQYHPKKKTKPKQNIAGYQWLTSIIPATQEAALRRIAVRSQPRQIVHKTLAQKYLIQNRAGGVAQVVEHLPSKCKTLSSSPTTDKKEKKADMER
jgi:hypothetical protein